MKQSIFVFALILIFSGCGENNSRIAVNSVTSHITDRTVTSSNNGCWNSLEKAEISSDELDGKVTFFLKDDTSCQKISDAQVEFAGKIKQSNSDGKVSFPISLIEKINNRKVPLKIRKKGYINYKTYLDVMIGTVWKNRFLLSKDMSPKSVKFVLEWSENPKDLDLHFKTDSYHIYYGNRNSSQGEANLDVDDVSSFGPETILVKNIKYNKKYELYINVYSPHNARINKRNRATLTVYKDNRLDKIINIKDNNQKRVDILTINNGFINYKF